MTVDALHPIQRPGRAIATVHRPSQLHQALALLSANPAARPLAGGTDLLLDLHRGGPGEPVTLIDLTGIVELNTIVVDDDRVTLGAGVTHNDVVAHPHLRSVGRPLVRACLEVGSPQLRNRATVAGNIATASPANDTISALLALDATVHLARLDGGEIMRRDVPIDLFFTGFRSTVLDDAELITAISFPALDPWNGAIWVKLGNRAAQAISVVHACVVLDRDDEAVVTSARVALGSVAERVVLVPEAAALLIGSELDDATIEAAAQACAGAVEPLDDVRASADYRSATIPVLIRRALRAIHDNHAAETLPAEPPCLGSRRRAAVSAPEITAETEVAVTLNGQSHSARDAADATLLDWLRDTAGLTGTKEGCAEGECGACTVRLDGQAVMSCLVNAAQADGATITTVEGLTVEGQPHPLQAAFVDEFAVQCGFCIPGFIVAGSCLLDEIDDPTDDQIDLGLSGNLCRCTGYYPIKAAIRTAASADDGATR